MPKGSNQKLKLYHLSRIMLELTDEDHYITMAQILEELARYDVTADRKSIYDDLAALEHLGLEVKGEAVGRSYHYHVVDKQFELAELKLLVDAIQSSKFITERKSHELIHKIEQFASRYEAQQLNRQVMVTGRVKTLNEKIYYNVDAIHAAINDNKQISFEYMNWNMKKELVPRREEPYVTSPWALAWDDENYYLIGYNANHQMINHYRVDKMRRIKVLNEKREGRAVFREFNPAKYAKSSFGMFGGEVTDVKLRCENSMIGVILDRFGKDIMIRPDGKDHFITNVEVSVSDQFFGWIFGLGGQVQILSPADVVKKMKETVRRVQAAHA